MAEIEIQYIVPTADSNDPEVVSLVKAMNGYRQWTPGELKGDWLQETIYEGSTQVSLTREIMDARLYSSVQQTGEVIRKELEATFDESERERLSRRFAGFIIHSAADELIVE